MKGFQSSLFHCNVKNKSELMKETIQEIGLKSCEHDKHQNKTLNLTFESWYHLSQRSAAGKEKTTG